MLDGGEESLKTEPREGTDALVQPHSRLVVSTSSGELAMEMATAGESLARGYLTGFGEGAGFHGDECGHLSGYLAHALLGVAGDLHLLQGKSQGLAPILELSFYVFSQVTRLSSARGAPAVYKRRSECLFAEGQGESS